MAQHPRGFQLIRAAIPGLTDLGELGRLREFAKEQWGADPLYRELDALFAEREGELRCEPGTQIPLPLEGEEGDGTR